MKFTYALLAAVIRADDLADNVPDDEWQGPSQTGIARSGSADRQLDQEKRYDDLEAIAKKYWAKQGETGKNRFDARKYWAYGCHCFMLGDRPMTEMGKGSPVDALDNKCKAYKDCQKCVRGGSEMKGGNKGDTCIGEFTRYTWKYSSKAEAFVSNNPAGSCERELFECDLQFVKDIYEAKDVFSNDYHAFWSTTGFDHQLDSSCPTGGSAPVTHECCGGQDKPFYWINLNNQVCEAGAPKAIQRK